MTNQASEKSATCAGVRPAGVRPVLAPKVAESDPAYLNEVRARWFS
jgi:hypothetical protein